MKIPPFKAVFDGKSYRLLPDGVDASKYKRVDEFAIETKPSTVMTIAQAKAMVSTLAPPQRNGMRSPASEEWIYPFAYVHEHATEVLKNGVAVKSIDMEFVQSLGAAVVNHIWNHAEAFDPDFLVETPPSVSKGGEKDTDPNSKTSSKS